ncbi:MAG TPA: sensor histidine kinase [Flexistipes sinusarabici]|uniref:histidine kinase n=1 Tax=Flexistipes sinusarabici TaxID=2352 RepID=A0A3D5QDR3_FLESI|nr:sensor histidine kinase [Flexistipes sinusarabici]
MLKRVRKRFSELSLTKKFLIVAISIMFIFLLVMNIMIQYHFKNYFISRERQHFTDSLHSILRNRVRFFTFRKSWNENMDFNPLVNILKREKGVIDIILYSAEGKRLYSLISGNKASAPSKSEGLRKALRGEPYFEINDLSNTESYDYLKNVTDARYVQEIYYPVLHKGEVQGVIEVYKDFTDVMNAINNTRYQAAGLTLLGFIIYIAVLSWIVLKIEKREKELQAEVMKYQKLSLLGQFASKMAHEIGTPIHVIMGNLDLMEDVTEDNVILKRIDSVSRQITKIQTIIKNYLYLSKKPEPARSKFDISELIENVVDDLSFAISDKIEIKTDTQSCMIYSDSGFLEQVLYNFVKNASDSIGEKNGNIFVKSYKDGDYVVVKVYDDGKGVPEEIREKLFDPFFSTKKTGKGTGLGLSVCKDLVEALNGEIFYDSEDNYTIFGIKVPVREDVS